MTDDTISKAQVLALIDTQPTSVVLPTKTQVQQAWSQGYIDALSAIRKTIANLPNAKADDVRGEVTDDAVIAGIDAFNEAAVTGELFLTARSSLLRMRAAHEAILSHRGARDE